MYLLRRKRKRGRERVQKGGGELEKLYSNSIVISKRRTV